jgi:PAS domain S-box-containing protein
MEIDRMVDIRRIFDSVSEIWILLDRQGTVLLKSRHLDKFQHIVGSLSEGVQLMEVIPEDWRLLAENVLITLEYSRVPSVLEATFTDHDKKETHFEIKCTAIRGDDDELLQIFIEGRDVTPQKIFEKKITIVARDYQSVIENANAVIIGTDSRGYITEWNEMAHQVTGYSKNECYIRRLSDFLLAGSQEDFSNAMKSVLSDRVITNYEMIIQASDKRKLTLLINATPRTSASGEVIGILLIGQDITELSDYRRSLEKKVRERTEALKSALESEKKLVEVKDRFVSMASHEFRSPISYIHRNIGALNDHIESLSPEEVRNRLFKIRSQAEHLNSLLEDVLTIGKTGASNTKIKANLNDVDLKEFLNRIIDEVQSNLQNTHHVELDFAFENITIRSDENLLRNIFVNLLTNAIKFSPGKNVVNLHVNKCEQHVQCRIQDYGLGIEEKDLGHIFEPFHRGANAAAIKGTGLGLPIVKKAVETLGGDLAVASKPGEGTLFTVTLNLHD